MHNEHRLVFNLLNKIHRLKKSILKSKFRYKFETTKLLINLLVSGYGGVSMVWFGLW